MPQKNQTIAVPGYTSQQILPLAYGTFQELGWTAEHATDSRLIGYTKKNFNSYYDHVIVDAADNELVITSKLPDTATWDITKRNKKNLARFDSAFAKVKDTATEYSLKEWSDHLEILQQQTVVAIEQETREMEEVEKVMKLSTGSKTVTYSLMGLNIVLFIIMIISGVHLMEPTVGDIADWGGNYKPYTISGEWWRLITSTFIHVGIIHLLLNMYALYQAGIYLEPMLGRAMFTVAYLCTGVLASVCSIWWRGDESVSAGASGAVFGLYGVFLALLSTNLIPKALRNSLLQSIAIFIIYNLLYGAKSEAVDNAAHIGGFISGLIFGYAYFFSFKKPGFKPAMAIGLVAVITVAITIGYLKDADSSVLAYQRKIEQVSVLEEEALRPYNESNNDDSALLQGLETVSSKKWKQARDIMEETEQYDLNEGMARHRTLLTEYVDLRNKHTELAIRALKGDESVNNELQEVNGQIESTLNKMKE